MIFTDQHFDENGRLIAQLPSSEQQHIEAVGAFANKTNYRRGSASEAEKRARLEHRRRLKQAKQEWKNGQAVNRGIVDDFDGFLPE